MLKPKLVSLTMDRKAPDPNVSLDIKGSRPPKIMPKMVADPNYKVKRNRENDNVQNEGSSQF